MKFGRKITGGRYHQRRKRKLTERVRQVVPVKLGKEKKVKIRIRGGHIKVRLLSVQIANVLNKEGKSVKTTIKNVVQTPANKFLARQNILIKGAIIETELGKARITNRPSQEGSVQAVLVE
ncbi:30S ribosomal protein S8e [Candidatus Pacearchaeota archaeon]|nr:30S ribosomal protein S8e [Candidatus Pacearchaeota archaeon]